MMEIDHENYRGKSKDQKLSMKQIFLLQIKKIMELGSIELRGGYEEETIIIIDGQPQVIKKYVPDGRQAYNNAVQTLEAAVINYIVGDNPKADILLADIKKVQEKKKNLYLKYQQDLKQNKTDSQLLKYRYLSDKRKLCEESFSKIMVILRRSDFFGEEDE